jgi:GGDEF domain-containing protein
MGISVNYASYLLRGALNKLRATFESQSRMPEERAATAYGRAPLPGAAADEVVMNHAPTAADPVTGLACAPYFDERVRQEVERSKRYPQTFAVLVLELPEAAARPPLCAALADALRHSVRQVDVLTRYGRTSFALLLPHTGREARVLSERLVTSVPKAAAQQCNADDLGGEPLRVTVGYAVYPTDGRSAEHLITGASRAAKEAAASGDTAVVRSSPRRRRPATG